VVCSLAKTELRKDRLSAPIKEELVFKGRKGFLPELIEGT